jgi:glycosyl transferase family 87
LRLTGRERTSPTTNTGLLRTGKLPHLLAFLMLIHGISYAWVSATKTPNIDFFTFWSVSQAASTHPVANIYSPEGQRDMASIALAAARTSTASDMQRRAAAIVLGIYDGRIDATGSPLLYAGIAALSSGNFLTDQKRFLLASMLFLVLSVLLLKRLLNFTGLQAMLLLTFLFLYYEPVVSDLNVGNVNEIQLLAIVLFIFFATRSQPMLAGLVIGAVTVFKPTTVLVLALAVGIGVADQDYKRLSRLLVGAGVAVVALLAASTAYFGTPAVWFEFLRSLPRTLHTTSYTSENGNVSLSALFGGMSGHSSLIAVALLAGLGWLLFATRKRDRSSVLPSSTERNSAMPFHSAFFAAGCGCAVMLLSSPLAWVHYYLLLLPLTLYLVMTPAPSRDGVAPYHHLVAAADRDLPFLPFVVFSLLFGQMLSNHLRLLCATIMAATILTLAVAVYRIWQLRCALNLPESIT